MPRTAELFFRPAIVFLVLGVGIGILMAISRNHNVMGAHAHINLLGWVTSAIFGGYYALNPAKAEENPALAAFVDFYLNDAVASVSEVGYVDLDEETLTLFAVQKLADNHTADILPNHPIVREWWDYMADIMEVNPDNSPACKPLVEVFHAE